MPRRCKSAFRSTFFHFDADETIVRWPFYKIGRRLSCLFIGRTDEPATAGFDSKSGNAEQSDLNQTDKQIANTLPVRRNEPALCRSLDRQTPDCHHSVSNSFARSLRQQARKAIIQQAAVLKLFLHRQLAVPDEFAPMRGRRAQIG